MANTVTKKQKLISKLEERLLSTKKYISSWWIIFALTILFFALTIATLLTQFLPHNATVNANLEQNHSYALASQILVYIAFGVFAIPYLYLSGAWMSGLNNITRSKYFHLTLWINYSIIYLIAIIALILNIRSVLL